MGVKLPPPGDAAEYERLLREAAIREDKLIRKLDARGGISIPPKAPGMILPTWTGIAALVTALGAGVAQVMKPQPTDLSPQIEDLRTDVKALRSDMREIRDYTRKARATDTVRWDIAAGAICKLNAGVPFARGVDCSAAGSWVPPTLPAPDALAGWRSSEEWPPPERAP